MSHADDPLRWMEPAAAQPLGLRVAFDRQLSRIDTALVELTVAVADRIRPLTAAFLAGDIAEARRITAANGSVAQGCLSLEERCLELLARQAPVAGDLRHVIAVLRAVADVSRSSGLLRHIAKALTWVHPPSTGPEIRETVRALGDVAAEIFFAAAQAWRHHDALAAIDLEQIDDSADRQQKVLLRDLYVGECSVEEAVSLALVSRYYERIADHGVEIARHVAYVVTGDRPTVG